MKRSPVPIPNVKRSHILIINVKCCPVLANVNRSPVPASELSTWETVAVILGTVLGLLFLVVIGFLIMYVSRTMRPRGNDVPPPGAAMATGLPKPSWLHWKTSRSITDDESLVSTDPRLYVITPYDQMRSRQVNDAVSYAPPIVSAMTSPQHAINPQP